MHLPDIFVFKPIFYDGELLAYGPGRSAITPMSADGCPGSNASDSTEIYQEGLRIPPLKLFDRGKRNETLFALIERNVRVPVKVFGDLRAQLAACHISESSLIELARHYGPDKVQSYMRELIDYSERMTRAAIRELPDGVYDFLDHIDDDGIDVGKPIPLKVTITKSGDQIKVDWTGSSPQVKGAINNTLSFTKSASYCAIRSILPANIPNNEGVFRAIEVTAPPGTIANDVLPAACAARGLTGFRMIDCHVRRTGQDAARQGVRLLRRRQYRHFDRRLLRRPQALHLRRFHLLRLGRASVCGRPRRQLQHLRQHGLAVDRGDRDRAADPD